MSVLKNNNENKKRVLKNWKMVEMSLIENLTYQ